jgi:excinuclease ABC subunit A
MGPGAGEHGGHVVARGTAEEIMAVKESLTGQFLSGTRRIDTPEQRRKPTGWVEIVGASEHNLKNVDVKVPLGTMVAVTGVSGAGKSSLINATLYPALNRVLHRSLERVGPYKTLTGLGKIDKVIVIDQKPIGRTPRSNPATYTKAFDLIRELYAGTPAARTYGYAAGRFSFNVSAKQGGGRCEACEGAGVREVEMHFLPNVFVTCEVCKGKRYNDATLRVTYKDKNIAEILDTPIDDALEMFQHHKQLSRIMQTLVDVGLGYLSIGQPATTLSGGEAQRVKLAKELARVQTGRTLYLLDEPTTGLHMADVKKLLEVLGRLVDGGNTVLVIEHNLDVIKTADWIIDLGPEGGAAGGEVIAAGTPEQVAEVAASYTGQFLKPLLARDAARHAAPARTGNGATKSAGKGGSARAKVAARAATR